ncbi:MAG: type II CAAX endopeptidase family protein [Oenococcus sp.]|uniref:CPBP family intramembrane glutamic endopeptidase n=1 Tax=Oenococcus TaxID=46254 RepID=UPI0021E97DAA|nr:type II CAAX endopeptidase family protein [Oenococcus kitaharae]MCV3295761.1 CPBP family intramembrane metalloprotease [Oenococcus kitaharae]
MKSKRDVLLKSFLIFFSTIISLILGSILGSILISVYRLLFYNSTLAVNRDPFLLSWLAILGESFAILFIFLFNHFFFKIRVSFFNHSFFLGLKVASPSILFVLINLLVFSSQSHHLSPFELFTALAVSLSVGIFEEYAARGLMLGNLLSQGSRTFSFLAANLLSAMFFAGLHLINLFSASIAVTAIQMIYVFALGLIFASAYIFSKNLSVTILIHALIDGLAFAANPQAIFGLGNPKVTATQFAFQAILLIIFLYYTFRLFKKENLNEISKKWF